MALALNVNETEPSPGLVNVPMKVVPPSSETLPPTPASERSNDPVPTKESSGLAPPVRAIVSVAPA